ncbi:MAG: hypothetical protein ACTHN5_11290 [Phycisphaerae bacterium]
MSNATAPTRSARLTLLLICALSVLSFCTFWGVVRNDFVPFDDDIEIINNPHIEGGLTAENLAWMFSDTRQTERYTPLSWVAWAMVCSAAGLKAGAFHAEALMVHVINTVLVYLVFCELLPWVLPGVEARRRQACAAIAAAIWSVHPLRVEVVAWVTQVRFAEATLFALLSMLLYVRARGAAGDGLMRRLGFWMSVGSYFVSILFYPNGIGLFLVIGLLELFVFRAKWRVALVRAIPFVPAAILVALMTVYGRFADVHSSHAAVGLAQFDLAHRVMQAAYMFVCYLWKPFDITHISPVYTVLVHFDPFSPLFLLSFVGVGLLTAAAIVFRKRRPGWAFLWFSHLALIAPVGGYFEFPYYPSDRYSYLDAILWMGAAAVLFFRAWQAARPAIRPALLAAAAALVGVLAIVSAAQTTTWRNGETLYRHVLSELGNDPYAVDIHVRLARYYLEHRELPAAIAEEEAALKIWPAYPPAQKMRAELVSAVEQAGSAPAPAHEDATLPVR